MSKRIKRIKNLIFLSKLLGSHHFWDPFKIAERYIKTALWLIIRARFFMTKLSKNLDV